MPHIESICRSHCDANVHTCIYCLSNFLIQGTKFAKVNFSSSDSTILMQINDFTEIELDDEKLTAALHIIAVEYQKFQLIRRKKVSTIILNMSLKSWSQHLAQEDTCLRGILGFVLLCKVVTASAVTVVVWW